MKQTETILNRIELLRTCKNVSVNKMCKDAGLNKSIVDNLKKERMPTVDKIAQLAEYFNVSTDYLLGKTDIKNKPSAENGIELTDRRKLLINLFEDASPEIQEFVLKALSEKIEQEK